ncbi:MAG: SGNH/GDSL hydrolase family protein [Chitinophagales bacterium]
MKKIILFTVSIVCIILSFSACSDIQGHDEYRYWCDYYKSADFNKYKADNEKIGLPEEEAFRVVFMGNSITEAWVTQRPDFFEGSAYVGRGISGQTTLQMLLRFREDVIDLEPKAVVILAGVNDIAGNWGFTTLELIVENIKSMVELARYHDIEVILCSVLPAIHFPWRPELAPANDIIKLNGMIQKYAQENKLIFVDYHTAMKDEKNGLKVPEYTSANDLVHPNVEGYKVMEKLVTPAIEQALNNLGE